MEDLLKRGAEQLGIELSPVQIRQFSVYTALLIEWNEKFNLTGITEPAEIAVKHHLDSLTCLKANIPKKARIADVGTGAGFPGLPLAIARPDLSVTLIDATKKRLTFLEAVRDAVLEIAEDEKPTIELVHARAEDAGRMPEHREHYDVVVARAVADMRALVEYCLPLVRVGGKFIAMKGPEVEHEVTRARPGTGTLGGGAPEIVHLTLPDTDIGRRLVIIKKNKPTPEQFPRHSSRIASKPL